MPLNIIDPKTIVVDQGNTYEFLKIIVGILHLFSNNDMSYIHLYLDNDFFYEYNSAGLKEDIDSLVSKIFDIYKPTALLYKRINNNSLDNFTIENVLYYTYFPTSRERFNLKKWLESTLLERGFNKDDIYKLLVSKYPIDNRDC